MIQFDRDARHYAPTPRTLQTSKFGPYARLSVTPMRRRVSAVFWMLLYGVGIGVCWWLAVAIRASSL